MQSGVASSPAMRSVSPAVTTNYTVTALSDYFRLLGGNIERQCDRDGQRAADGERQRGGGRLRRLFGEHSGGVDGRRPVNNMVGWGGAKRGGEQPGDAQRSPAVTTNYTVTALSDSTGCWRYLERQRAGHGLHGSIFRDIVIAIPRTRPTQD